LTKKDKERDWSHGDENRRYLATTLVNRIITLHLIDESKISDPVIREWYNSRDTQFWLHRSMNYCMGDYDLIGEMRSAVEDPDRHDKNKKKKMKENEKKKNKKHKNKKSRNAMARASWTRRRMNPNATAAIV